MSLHPTAIVFVLLGFVLLRNLRGFLTFLQPGSVRYLPMAGVGEADVIDPALRRTFREVEELGFAHLGKVLEKRPFSRDVEQHVFAGPSGAEWAVVFAMGREAWMHVLTLLPQGTLVCTADHRAPSTENRAFVTGGLPGASPGEVLSAHRRRVKPLLGDERADGPRDLESYMRAARELRSRGPWKQEIRRRAIRPFLFASAALAWAALTLWKVLTAP